MHLQACMRPCAPDALPIIGRVPGHDNVYLNCGHNCWGRVPPVYVFVCMHVYAAQCHPNNQVRPYSKVNEDRLYSAQYHKLFASVASYAVAFPSHPN